MSRHIINLRMSFCRVLVHQSILYVPSPYGCLLMFAATIRRSLVDIVERQQIFLIIIIIILILHLFVTHWHCCKLINSIISYQGGHNEVVDVKLV